MLVSGVCRILLTKEARSKQFQAIFLMKKIQISFKYCNKVIYHTFFKTLKEYHFKSLLSLCYAIIP